MARRCADWIKAYLHHSRNTEAPIMFHFWTGVWTLAGALRRQVWVDQMSFQWTPNFYIILVGPPGVATKSTTMHKGLNFLRKVEGITIGPQSVTWPALLVAMAKAGKTFTDNEGRAHVHSPISCAVSELGTFLKPSDFDMVDLLIELWDGWKGNFDRKTKTAGEDTINTPWINIIGCTTPSWITTHIPEVMIGGGLMSRVVFVYADKKERLIPYPADVIVGEEYEAEFMDLLEDLCHISTLVGAYELTPEAKEWGTKWYIEHNTQKRDHSMASDRYQGYLSRKQGHIHKLALVLAASVRDELVITEEDVKKAHSFVTKCEADMSKVFASVGAAETSKDVKEIMSLLSVIGAMQSAELWRRCITTMSPKAFEEAIKAGIRAGYLQQAQEGNDIVYRALMDVSEIFKH